MLRPRKSAKKALRAKISLIPFLVILAALSACFDPAPTPETAETPTPGTIAATAPPPANTPEPTAPIPSTPSTPRATSPPSAQDQRAVISSLSDAELVCVGQNPERMLATLTGGAPASMEEQARLIGCLDDDTVDLIFMNTIIPVPLSVETSDCILAALDVIDPRAVMSAGLEGDPQTAMAGSMAMFTVSVACLNEKEWAAAAPRLGMEPEDRDGMVCVMAALGGPAEMADGHGRGDGSRGRGGGDRPTPSRPGMRDGAVARARRPPRNRRQQPPRRSTRRPRWHPRRRRSRRLTVPTPAPKPTRTPSTPVATTAKHPGDHRRRHPPGHPQVRPVRLEALDRRGRRLPGRPAGGPHRRVSRTGGVRDRPGMPGGGREMVGTVPGTPPREPAATSTSTTTCR